MDHGVDATQRVPEGEMIAEIAERDLHSDALGAEPPRVANEATNGRSGGRQPPEQGQSDRAGGARQQKHRQEATRRMPSSPVPDRPLARHRLQRNSENSWPTSSPSPA